MLVTLQADSEVHRGDERFVWLMTQPRRIDGALMEYPRVGKHLFHYACDRHEDLVLKLDSPMFRVCLVLALFYSIRSQLLPYIHIESVSYTMGLRGHNLSLAQLFLIVAPSFILFGYNQAGVGGLISLKDWVKTFPEIDTVNTTGATKSHNATIQGVVVATFVLGALVGALSCMFTGDVFGRRKIVFAAAVLTLIGEVLCTSSFELAQFVVGRTIIGAGVGMISATVPVWQAECSSSANRGKHVVLDGLFMT